MAVRPPAESDSPITEINITPLVDVCLVLVIIFMAVIPFALRHGITVMQSRKNAAEGKATAEDNVVVRLGANGVITLNGAAVAPENYVISIARALQSSKDGLVVVVADNANRVGQVVWLLDDARQAGAAKLALMKE